MRKTVLTLILILCLPLSLSLTGCKVSVKAQNRTWTVGHDRLADFTSIQEAVNSNDVFAGDTILVYKGVYNESVEINKSVILIGEDRSSTVINGDPSSEFVVSIVAYNVKVTNFTVKKDVATPRDSGIRLGSSSGSEVSHNDIIGVLDGIILYSGGNNVISDNLVLASNDAGISLIFSIGNRFTGNTISNSQKGIMLSASRSNTFTGNTVSNNSEGASLTFTSVQNKFYDNNFIDNTKSQVITDGSSNFWSFNGEGNYWNNYNGSDQTKDGIGEQPYTIDSSNVDGAPLMGTFNSFNVVSAEKEYQVTIVSNSTVSDFTFEIGPETGNKVIRYAINGEDATFGFSRVSIPTSLMNFSLLLISGDEAKHTQLNRSSSSLVYLYFTYAHTDQIITIISSETWNLLQELNTRFPKLQEDLNDLNLKYSSLHINYNTLFKNHSELLQHYLELNTSYNDHLSEYNDTLQNLRSLMYIFAGISAVFIATTVYLSSRLHARKTKPSEDKR